MLLMATGKVTCDKWHEQMGQRIKGILEKIKGNGQWYIHKATGINIFQVMH